MKNKTLLIRTLVILIVTLGGLYIVFGPRRAPVAADFTWEGIKANLAENISLGLDLKGGSHLVMQVETDEYLKTLTENSAQAAVTAATDEGLQVSNNTVVAENGTYSITLEVSDAEKLQAVIDADKKKVDFANWNESTSGNTVTWSLSTVQQNLRKT